MRRTAVAALLLALPCAAATAQPPAPKFKIQAADHQTVTATIGYEIRTTNYAVSRWIVYVPEPPELPSQTKVKTTSTPVAKVVAEKSPIARKVRLIDLPVANPVPGAKLPLKMEIEATLRTRKLVPLDEGEKAPKVAPLTPGEQKHYTSPGAEIDFDSKPVQGWIEKKKLRLRKGEEPLELAARVLETFRSDYTYHYDGVGDVRASRVCELDKGDCGDMTSLFVAAMRANKIPARAVVGRMALPRKDGSGPGDTGYNRPHIKAEFYLAGVGWVPVEPSGVIENKMKPIDAYVGHDPGDMIVLHVDFDLRLTFPSGERVSRFLQTDPSYWVTGKGPIDAKLGPTGWELKAAPVEKK